MAPSNQDIIGNGYLTKEVEIHWLPYQGPDSPFKGWIGKAIMTRLIKWILEQTEHHSSNNSSSALLWNLSRHLSLSKAL